MGQIIVRLVGAPGLETPGKAALSCLGGQTAVQPGDRALFSGGAADAAMWMGPTAVMEEADQKQCTLYDFMQRTFQKMKAMLWGQKQTCGCLGTGDWGVRSWELRHRHFGGDGCVSSLDLGDGFVGVCVSVSSLTNCTLQMLAVYCRSITYTSNLCKHFPAVAVQ